MCLTSILIDPVQENVHGSCLGDLVVVSVQPEYLLTPELLRLILSGQTTAIVPTETQNRGQVSVKGRISVCRPLPTLPVCSLQFHLLLPVCTSARPTGRGLQSR